MSWTLVPQLCGNVSTELLDPSEDGFIMSYDHFPLYEGLALRLALGLMQYGRVISHSASLFIMIFPWSTSPSICTGNLEDVGEVPS